MPTTTIEASDIIDALDRIQTEEGSIEEILGLIIKRRIKQFLADERRRPRGRKAIGGSTRSLRERLNGQPFWDNILLDEPESRYVAREIGGLVFQTAYTANVSDLVYDAVKRLLEPTGLLQLLEELRVRMYGGSDGKIYLTFAI